MYVVDILYSWKVFIFGFLILKCIFCADTNNDQLFKTLGVRHNNSAYNVTICVSLSNEWLMIRYNSLVNALYFLGV